MAEALSAEIRQARWNTADGVELAGDVGGDPAAPTVVLMHGGGQTRHSWAGAMGALVRAGYHVINYDARGHGESGWSDKAEYSLPVRARDLATVIDGVDGPVVLVGASLGGATGMYAVAHGYRPAALALVDIVPRPDPVGVGRIRDFMTSHSNGFGTLAEAADAVAAYNPHRARPSDNKGLRKNLRLREDGRLYWHWDPGILARPTEHDIAEFEGVVDGLKHAGDVPVLLVRGLKSDVVSDSGVAELRDALPALEIWDVASAGHMVAGDRNDAFNEGIIDFLSRHVPARALERTSSEGMDHG